MGGHSEWLDLGVSPTWLDALARGLGLEAWEVADVQPREDLVRLVMTNGAEVELQIQDGALLVYDNRRQHLLCCKPEKVLPHDALEEAALKLVRSLPVSDVIAWDFLNPACYSGEEEFEPYVDCGVKFRFSHAHMNIPIHGRHLVVTVSAYTGEVTLVVHVPGESIEFPEIGEDLDEARLLGVVHTLREELFPESTPDDVHLGSIEWVIAAGYLQDGVFHPWEGGAPKARLACGVAMGGKRKDVVMLLLDHETLQILVPR